MTQEEEEKKQYTPVNDTEEETNDFAKQKFNGYPHDPYAGATNVVVNPNEKDSYANALYQQSLGDNSAFATPKVKSLPTTPYNPVNTESKLSEVARQDKQNRERRFVKPNPNPTTYKEYMENMEAENEYNQQMYDRSKKWRTIANAIIGAGAIAGHIATGTAMPNTFMQTWDQTDKDALEELRYHRQMNMDKYNKQIALMQQDKQNALAMRKLKVQDNQYKENFRLKLEDLALRKQKADAANDLNEQRLVNAKIKELYDQARLDGYPELLKSIISRNYGQATNSYASANKNNTTADGKAVPLVVGNSTYMLPEKLEIADVLHAIQNKLGSMNLSGEKKNVYDKLMKEDITKYGDNTYENISTIINNISKTFPNEVRDVIISLQRSAAGNTSGASSASASSSSKGNKTQSGKKNLNLRGNSGGKVNLNLKKQ